MCSTLPAMRLAKAFRVNVAEMWISKNEVSGEITLKPKDDDQRQRNLAELFRMMPPRCIYEFVYILSSNNRLLQVARFSPDVPNSQCGDDENS